LISLLEFLGFVSVPTSLCAPLPRFSRPPDMTSVSQIVAFSDDLPSGEGLICTKVSLVPHTLVQPDDHFFSTGSPRKILARFRFLNSDCIPPFVLQGTFVSSLIRFLYNYGPPRCFCLLVYFPFSSPSPPGNLGLIPPWMTASQHRSWNGCSQSHDLTYLLYGFNITPPASDSALSIPAAFWLRPSPPPLIKESGPSAPPPLYSMTPQDNNTASHFSPLLVDSMFPHHL